MSTSAAAKRVFFVEVISTKSLKKNPWGPNYPTIRCNLKKRGLKTLALPAAEGSLKLYTYLLMHKL